MTIRNNETFVGLVLNQGFVRPSVTLEQIVKTRTLSIKSEMASRDGISHIEKLQEEKHPKKIFLKQPLGLIKISNAITSIFVNLISY